MKIAVYTIAKNEEKHVERWAESAKEADYRFILDTGSSDDTVALATSLGVNVAVGSVSPWRFDDARNTALALIPTDVDWCVSLDMDEVLVEGWRQKLEALEGTHANRVRCELATAYDSEGNPTALFGAQRIHRRNGFRWLHAIHEVVEPYFQEAVEVWSDIQIQHKPDQTKSRGQYLPMLEWAAKEEPHSDRQAFYLGREYFFHRRLEEAAKEFKRHLTLGLWKPERAASMRYLAKCEPALAVDWLSKAAMEDPGRREAPVELSQYYYEQRNWKECLDWAKLALLIEKKPLDYFCEDFAWGWLPYDLAAIAAYNLGLKDDAIAYGREALLRDKANERLEANLKFYEEM